MLEKLISENISFPATSYWRESLRLLANSEANYVSQNAATNVVVISKDGGKISDPGNDSANVSELDYTREKIANIEVDCKSSDIAD